MKNNRDLKAEITAKIVNRLEKGGLPPWECPWDKTSVSPIPSNFLTKSMYSGINIMLLWMEAQDRGYSSNSWLTFNQANQLGGVVRKGERSVTCIFYKALEVEDKNSDSGEMTLIPCIKSFNLFNVEQIDGLDIGVDDEKAGLSFDDENSQNLIDDCIKYCEQSGVGVLYGGNRAYYSPGLDLIKIPTTFKSVTGMAATLAHEVSHSTGHKKRLDRFDLFDNKFDTEIESYSFEELCAEISCALLCGKYGVESSIDQHASYLQSWLKAMKADKNFIFKAASFASKINAYFYSVIEEKKSNVA